MKLKKFLNLVLSLGVILLLSGDTAYSASQSTGTYRNSEGNFCRRLLLVYGAALR